MRNSIALIAAGTILAILVLPGCGGGGGNSQLPLASLTGLVTDVDGSPVVDATVRTGGRDAQSQSNGSWELYDIRAGYNRVTAEAEVNGQTWTGETIVDLAGGEHNRNTNIVVSDRRFHGRIEGFVRDNSGRAIPEAKVFVGGPISSTMALADSNGFYRAPALTPDVTYTVTASLAGYVNDSRSLHVAQSATTTANFTLIPGAGQGTIPAPQNVVAQAWTVSSVVTRADTRTKNVYEILKRHYRKLKGLPETPRLAERIERKGASRATPEGSLIEVDLFWDYEAFDDLFGYAIRRATSPGGLTNPSTETALARDPLTAAFFDIDYLLTPDVTYYYSVHRLDTIDFPINGLTGPGSSVVSAAPLQPLFSQNPGQDQVVVGDPIFRWNSVPRAARYTIYLWEFFPELLSDTDPNGVSNIWTTGNTTTTNTRTYNGPPLRSGHTYYWMVVGENADNSALAASEIGRFRTP